MLLHRGDESYAREEQGEEAQGGLGAKGRLGTSRALEPLVVGQKSEDERCEVEDGGTGTLFLGVGFGVGSAHALFLQNFHTAIAEFKRRELWQERRRNAAREPQEKVAGAEPNTRRRELTNGPASCGSRTGCT